MRKFASSVSTFIIENITMTLARCSNADMSVLTSPSFVMFLVRVDYENTVLWSAIGTVVVLVCNS